MTQDIGRSPDGSGYSAEPEPSSTVSAVPVSIPNAAWEHFADPGYFDMYCVRPVRERRFGCGFHLIHEEEARGLAELLTANAVTNPWSAISQEDAQ